MALATPVGDPDYYEFLQISPRAEFATIHRIYRFLAARLHPDNPQTGDVEKFVLLRRAYQTLSDPESRRKYDEQREITRDDSDAKPDPVFAAKEFVDGIDGEANRRLGILAMLYWQRRTDPQHPEVSLHEVEKRMGWPREYLDFTTWYLASKTYITRADNSEFTLTALGVDFIEENYSKIPMLTRLLDSGPRTATSSAVSKSGVTD